MHIRLLYIIAYEKLIPVADFSDENKLKSTFFVDRHIYRIDK